MNANAFRHFFGYHFSENRALRETAIDSLSDEQFTRVVDYSHGSVRNQLVHLMSVDDTWIKGLQGKEIPEPLNPEKFIDRESICAHWDKVEQNMHTYLAGLTDDMLYAKPFEGEDKNLVVWQALLQVVNHGTDHRAQILRMLHDLGVKTTSQDYIFYVYDNP